MPADLPVVSTVPVTILEAEHGTVVASSRSASADTEVTLTVESETGYQLNKNGKAVPLEKKSEDQYAFEMPEGNVTVSAAFVEKSAMPFTAVKTGDWW